MEAAIFKIFLLMLGAFVQHVACDVSVVKRSDDVSPLESTVQQQALAIQTLQAKLTAMETRLANVESGLRNEEKQVAFHVRFSGSYQQMTQVGLHGTLKFDLAITNIGNAYSTETGTFTAPTPGVYLFLLGVINGEQTWGELALKKTGGSMLARTYNIQGHGFSYLRDTVTAVVHLQTGEQTWVEHVTGSMSYRMDHMTMFTGMLIQADTQ